MPEGHPDNPVENDLIVPERPGNGNSANGDTPHAPVVFTIQHQRHLLLKLPPPVWKLVLFCKVCTGLTLAGLLMSVHERNPDEAVSIWTVLRVGAGELLARAFGILTLLICGLLLWNRFARRQQLKNVDAIIREPVTFRLTREAWEEKSALAASTLQWEAFTGSTVKDGVLWMQLYKAHHYALPLEQIPDEAVTLILDQLKQRGRPVVDLRSRARRG